MRLDPFRVQFLTIALDSQAVLTLVGVAVAAILFRRAARDAGRDLTAGDWWDLVTSAVIGGRITWVATHLGYYVRSPLQMVVITDGGILTVGLVLGAAYSIRRLGRRRPDRAWRPAAGLVTLGALAAGLFERVGCALTTCGGGPVTGVAWALQRGDEWREPVALYQVLILAAGLLLAVESHRSDGRVFLIGWIAFALVEAIIFWQGRGVDGLVAAAGAAGLYLGAALRENRRAHRPPVGSWLGRMG